jgi:hypothetical protein
MANASTDDELEAAFASFVRGGVGALLVTADPYFDVRRDRIVAFAAGSDYPPSTSSGNLRSLAEY